MKKDTRICSIDNAIFYEANAQRVTQSTRFSIEIYPPRTAEGHKKLPRILESYAQLGVTHVNVTGKVYKNYETLELVRFIKAELPHIVLVPHLVGYGLHKAECHDLIHRYVDMGIRNVFVVRGDVPDESTRSSDTLKMDFPHARDLVHEIKHIEPLLCIGVAGYPSGHYEQPNFLDDMRNLKHKVEAGADYIVTQLFFDNSEFTDFVERCRLLSIDVPIIPGITYVKSKQHIERIASLALGSVFPSQLLHRMYHAKNEEESYAIGEAWLRQQVQGFVNTGETSVHFYVFNGNQPFANIIECTATQKSFCDESIVYQPCIDKM